MSDIFYRAFLEITDDQGNPYGKNIYALTVAELVDQVKKAGDGWSVHHAHKIISDTEAQTITGDLNDLLKQKREAVARKKTEVKSIMAKVDEVINLIKGGKCAS